MLMTKQVSRISCLIEKIIHLYVLQQRESY